VVLNEGTKVVPFLEDDPKEYEATLRLEKRPPPTIARERSFVEPPGRGSFRERLMRCFSPSWEGSGKLRPCFPP